MCWPYSLHYSVSSCSVWPALHKHTCCIFNNCSSLSSWHFLVCLLRSYKLNSCNQRWFENMGREEFEELGASHCSGVTGLISFFPSNSRNALIPHMEPNTLRSMQRRSLGNQHKSCQKLPRSAAYISLEVVYS